MHGIVDSCGFPQGFSLPSIETCVLRRRPLTPVPARPTGRAPGEPLRVLSGMRPTHRAEKPPIPAVSPDPGGSLNAEPLTTVSASECRISTGSNRCLKSWSKRGKSCLRRCESVIKLVSACRRNKQSLINVSGSMSIWETSVVLIDHNIMLPPKFSRILLEAYLRPIRDFTPESRTWQV